MNTKMRQAQALAGQVESSAWASDFENARGRLQIGPFCKDTLQKQSEIRVDLNSPFTVVLRPRLAPRYAERVLTKIDVAKADFSGFTYAEAAVSQKFDQIGCARGESSRRAAKFSYE